MDLKCQPTISESETWIIGPSKIHGRGMFAQTLIPKGARILEYQGDKISKSESLQLCEAQNEYILSVSKRFDLNGNVEWNPARFLNHSCDPNCEALLERERIWIMAIRDITVGEELTFNYGYDLEDYRHYPCNCGAAACTGFMIAEEFFDYVRNQSTTTV